MSDIQPPEKAFTNAIEDLWAVGAIMCAIATVEISGSEAIDGTWIDYLGRQIEVHTNAGNEAMERCKRRGAA